MPKKDESSKKGKSSKNVKPTQEQVVETDPLTKAFKLAFERVEQGKLTREEFDKMFEWVITDNSTNFGP